MKKKFSVTGLTTIYEDWGDDPQEFCIQLHCEVASDDSGGEAFVVTVMSPAAVARSLGDTQSIEWGRGCLFMADYSSRAVQVELQRFIERSNAATWDELADYVTRYFNWI